MQANSWHELFYFDLSFWIWKVERKEKIQKFEYLENEKSFLDEIKNIFDSFWRAKLTIEIMELRPWRGSSACIYKFEHISYFVLVLLFLSCNK